MTRKHYNLIAETINGLIADGTLSPMDGIIVASRFATVLRPTNERFDSGRFYTAATKDLPRKEAEMVADLGGEG
jgi:hypothetical protein